MNVLVRIIVAVAIVVVLGGAIALAISGLTPTIKRVEIVIPDDRFPR